MGNGFLVGGIMEMCFVCFVDDALKVDLTCFSNAVFPKEFGGCY